MIYHQQPVLQRYVAHVDEIVVCRSCNGGLEEKGEDDCEVAELVEVHVDEVVVGKSKDDFEVRSCVTACV